jgi:hypothetical protein
VWHRYRIGKTRTDTPTGALPCFPCLPDARFLPSVLLRVVSKGRNCYKPLVTGLLQIAGDPLQPPKRGRI